MAVEHITLRDGGQVVIRPVQPEDRDRIAAGFDRLSPESRYRRFFSPVSRLSERQLDHLTQVDHHDHEALLALDADGERLVGVARFVRTGPGRAEPAMVVGDDWQGRGIATVLLTRLVDRALDEGIETFNAPVLADNVEAIAVLRRRGATRIERHGHEVDLEIALEPPAQPVAPGSPLRRLLRILAAETIDPTLTFWHRLIPRGGGEPDEDRANVVVAAVIDPEDSPAVPLAQEIAGAGGAGGGVVAARHPLLAGPGGVRGRLGRTAPPLRGPGVG